MVSAGVVELAVAGLIECGIRIDAILPAVIGTVIDALVDDYSVREHRSTTL
jgi:hypothetical protein